MMLTADCSPLETTKELTYLESINLKEKRSVYPVFLVRTVPIGNRWRDVFLNKSIQ